MERALISILTILAGATLSVQAGINAQLDLHWAHSPILAALVSFLVGTLGLLLCLLVTRTPVPPFSGRIVPWHWSGGLYGAFLVTITVVAAQRLGATTMIALVLAGQIGSSLVLDHFGFVGYAQKPMSRRRLLGALLLGLGVLLIKIF